MSSAGVYHGDGTARRRPSPSGRRWIWESLAVEVSEPEDPEASMVVTAWILDAATRQPVWRMSAADVRAVPGSLALRQAGATLALPAGDYEVHLASILPAHEGPAGNDPVSGLLARLGTVGDPDRNEGAESVRGWLLRRGTAGEFRNFVIQGFKNVGLEINGSSSLREAAAGNLRLSHAVIFNTGESEDSTRAALRLRGTAITNVLHINKGSVDFAYQADDAASAIATVSVGYRDNVAGDARARFGPGVGTLTQVNIRGGNVEFNSALGTVTMTDGELRIMSGAVTTLNLDGGTVYYGGVGTLSTANIGDGGSMLTNINMVPQHGQWRFPSAVDLRGVGYGTGTLSIGRNATGTINSTLTCHSAGAEGESAARGQQALRLVLYKLERLDKHMEGVHRNLNDLRTLRRLLLHEREPGRD